MKRILLPILFIASLQLAQAQAPGTLSFQGILVDGAGAPVTDGTHSIQFNFYDAGGTSITSRTINLVTTFKGMFTCVIGNGKDGVGNPSAGLNPALPDVTFNQQVSVGIVPLDIAPASELVPRIALTSVPYAITANTMDAAGLTGTIPSSALDTDLQDLADGSLTGSLVGTGINANNITTGTLGIANGGTGATTAAAARTALGAGVGSVTNVTGTAPVSVATGSSTPVISIAQANASTNGFLSSTDWNTFNNKLSTAVTNVTGTAPISVATGSTTPAISIAQANGATNGFLASTDWTTFNNKIGTATVFGGDLSGTHSAASVVKLQGQAVSGTTPTANQVLQYIGSTWTPASIASGGGTVTNVTGTAPVSVATGTTTPVISMLPATTSQNGYLSSTDWNTFNNKVGPLSPFAGDVTGNAGATTVAKLQGQSVSGATPTANQVLQYIGSTWTPTTLGAGGSVTSVGLSMPAIFTVSGSPVTTSGTLTSTLASQTANTIFAAPGAAAGAPTFRSLVAADVPNLDAGKITTGTLGLANGGTGGSTAALARTSLGLGALATLNTVGAAEITNASIVAADLSAGSVNGGAAGVITDGSVTSADLSTTGVVAASYGSTTQVGKFTVDAQGRITSASNVTIPTSGASTDGILTTADWNAFNNKQATITASNGLTLAANALSLGGALTANTTIGMSTFNLLFTNTTGKVGIGTPTPFSKVDIGGNLTVGNSLAGTVAAPANGALIQGNVIVGNPPTVPLYTNKPQLMVYNPAAGSGMIETLRVVGGATAAGDGPVINWQTAYGGNTPGSYAEWIQGAIGSPYSGTGAYRGDLTFYTNDGTVSSGPIATSAFERMRINSQGMIGIGTAAPAYSLDVNSTTSLRTLNLNNDNSSASTRYGLFNNVTSNGTGTRYGINSITNAGTAGANYGFYNQMFGNATNASSNFGTYNYLDPQGTGTNYGIYNYVANSGTGTRYGIESVVYAPATSAAAAYGIYSYVNNAGTGNSYILYASNQSSGTGTDYGLYISGEDINYFSGKVGIGTTAPTNNLTVAQVNGFPGNGIGISNTVTAKTAEFYSSSPNGDLWLGINSIHVGTWTAASGAYSAVSDLRMKKDIEPLSSVLGDVMKLKPSKYYFKSGSSDGPKNVGFIAQEVEPLFPSLVHLNKEDNLYSLDYSGFGVLAVKAIQEQQQQIDELKSTVSKLKAQVSELQGLSAQVEELRKLILDSSVKSTMTGSIKK